MEGIVVCDRQDRCQSGVIHNATLENIKAVGIQSTAELRAVAYHLVLMPGVLVAGAFAHDLSIEPPLLMYISLFIDLPLLRYAVVEDHEIIPHPVYFQPEAL